MKNPQPAEKSYILHNSFIDLSNVITGAFNNCGDSITERRKAIKKAWQPFRNASGFWASTFKFNWCLFPFSLSVTQLIFTAIFTPFICILITMFQVALLISLYLIVATLLIILLIADWFYCAMHKIVTHCPNCQAKFTLPKYRCECGKMHDNLRPGIYGVFKRTCVCGRKLSTSFLNGRHKLDAWCPSCNYDIVDDIASSICIPIVGGASSGKTCYISMTINTIEKNASRYGLTFDYMKNDRDEYENNVKSYLNKGKRPPKTTDYDNLTYYQFGLTPKGKMKQIISLCDVAGELYDVQESGDKITNQKGLKFADAFILILDPLSVLEYRNEVAKTTNIAEYGGSNQPIDEVVDTLLNTLSNIFNLNDQTMKKTVVAAVFTKLDLPGLSNLIGRDAVLKHSPGSDDKARYETQNMLCENFLKKYHEENFLKLLKRFKTVQYFTCSALGHTENGQLFNPQNVEEPFFWLLKQMSTVIKNAMK